jgi:hypothetical protein
VGGEIGKMGGEIYFSYFKLGMMFPWNPGFGILALLQKAPPVCIKKNTL